MKTNVVLALALALAVALALLAFGALASGSAAEPGPRSLAPQTAEAVPPPPSKIARPPRRARPPSFAQANGCGPADWRGRFVPNSPIGFNFGPACNAHDACYGIPWRRIAYSYAAAKQYCDSRFYSNMSVYCYKSFIGSPNIYRWCQYIAYYYYLAVRNYGGGAYASAQR